MKISYDLKKIFAGKQVDPIRKETNVSEEKSTYQQVIGIGH